MNDIDKKSQTKSRIVVSVILVVVVFVAAAIIVMLIGFGGESYDGPPGSILSLEATSPTSAKMIFGIFSPVPAPTDIRVMLIPASGAAINLSFSAVSFTTPIQATSSVAGVWANYTDFSYAGGCINSGDYIEISSGLTPGTTYTVKVYHIPSQSFCPLAGVTTFTTPDL